MALLERTEVEPTSVAVATEERVVRVETVATGDENARRIYPRPGTCTLRVPRAQAMDAGPSQSRPGANGIATSVPLPVVARCLPDILGCSRLEVEDRGVQTPRDRGDRGKWICRIVVVRLGGNQDR